MRRTMVMFLFLFSLIPVPALCGITNHLLQPDPGPNSRILAVHYVKPGNKPTKHSFEFGADGGRINLASGVVAGKADDGTEIFVPLSDVTKVQIRFDWDGRVREYDLMIDALLPGSDWPPAGRIRRVVLTSGLTIDFDMVGPGIDREAQSLFWSCEDEAAARIPFEDIALVQIRSNSFVTDFNELAIYGAVVEIELESGVSISVEGRSGIFDYAGGMISHSGGAVSLAEVRGVKVMDCRGLEEAIVPGVAAGMSALSEESEVEAFDFDNLDLSGEMVKLHEAGIGGEWVEGHVVSQDTLNLEILLEDGTRSVRLEKIDKLMISQGVGNKAGKGALIGGCVVGAAGLGLGIAMASDNFFDTSNGDVVAVTFLGFAAGALVGGAIGAAFKAEKWDEVDKIKVGVSVTPGNDLGLALSLKF